MVLHKDAIDPRLKEDALGRHGMYAKVIKEGILQVGETLRVMNETKEVLVKESYVSA